jgi:hypothetical protein
MSKNKKKYHSLRLLTMVLTSFMLPLGTFVGYEFGSGHTRIALLALIGQTALTFIHSYIWWITLEYEGKR